MLEVAFLASHGLGEACLNILHDHPDISVEVICTYPETHDGWWDGSVHNLAKELGYEVLTIDEEATLMQYEVDYIISVYYPNILSPELLAHPTEGSLNLHQAELPRYRGSNVFSHAIMNAREDDHWVYGTTIHFMAETVDAGDIVDRRFVDIEDEDTARELYEKTKNISIELFEATLPKIVSGEVHEMRTPQAEFEGEQYFYTKDSLDGQKEIPPAKIADTNTQIRTYDKIRALEFPPHKPAYTVLDGQEVYLTTELADYYQ